MFFRVPICLVCRECDVACQWVCDIFGLLHKRLTLSSFGVIPSTNHRFLVLVSLLALCGVLAGKDACLGLEGLGSLGEYTFVGRIQ
jgi:hypothetical protein